MLQKGVGVVGFAAAVGLITVLQTTTPATIHPLGILAVFVMMYTLVLAGLTYFFYGTVIGWHKFKKRSLAAPRRMFVRCYMYASLVALAPVILLAMSSVGQRSLMDILLVVVFELLACFYVWRRS